MEKETAELIAQEWAEVHQNKSSEAQNRGMKEELDAAPEPGAEGMSGRYWTPGVELQPVALIAENEVYILEPEGSKDIVALTRWPLSEVSVKDRETVHDAERPDSAGGRRWTLDLSKRKRVARFHGQMDAAAGLQ